MPAGTWEKIETKTLTSSAGLNFTSIPNTYTDLVITGQLRAAGGSAPVENCWFQFNGDSGANYQDMRAIAYSTSTYTNDTSNGQSQNYIGAISGPGHASSLYTSIYYMIHNYASTSHYRANQGSQICYNYEGNYRTGNWINLTQAINRIEFACGGGSGFAAGSTISIWGIKEAV